MSSDTFAKILQTARRLFVQQGYTAPEFIIYPIF
jgi:hypothetical protein